MYFQQRISVFCFVLFSFNYSITKFLSFELSRSPLGRRWWYAKQTVIRRTHSVVLFAMRYLLAIRSQTLQSKSSWITICFPCLRLRFGIIANVWCNICFAIEFLFALRIAMVSSIKWEIKSRVGFVWFCFIVNNILKICYQLIECWMGGRMSRYSIWFDDNKRISNSFADCLCAGGLLQRVISFIVFFSMFESWLLLV